MVGDAAKRAPALRAPNADQLTAALKASREGAPQVAVFKAPGFYTLDTEEPQILREVEALQVRCNCLPATPCCVPRSACCVAAE